MYQIWNMENMENCAKYSSGTLNSASLLQATLCSMNQINLDTTASLMYIFNHLHFFDTQSLDGQLQTSSKSTWACGFEWETKDMTDSFTLVIFHQGQLEITKSIMSCCDPSLTWPPPNTSFVLKLCEIKCQPTLTFASIWKLLDVKLK